jgi:hypothetical protein
MEEVIIWEADGLMLKCLLFTAKDFPDDIVGGPIAALVYGHPSPQIGQGKCIDPIPAIGGPEELEKNVVTCNRQDGPIAECPAVGCEIAAKHIDLTYIGATSILGGEDAKKGDAVIYAEPGLPVVDGVGKVLYGRL